MGKHGRTAEKRSDGASAVGKGEHESLPEGDADEAAGRDKADEPGQVPQNYGLLEEKSMINLYISFTTISMNQTIKVKSDFSGGLDLVFDCRTEITMQIK